MVVANVIRSGEQGQCDTVPSPRCNSCPVKSTCTTSDHGRDQSRRGPWPHSEAGQFHRGIACVIAGLALVFAGHVDRPARSGDVLVLATAGWWLWAARSACAAPWRSPANAPQHVPHRSGAEDLNVVAMDRFSTRWGGWTDDPGNREI